MRVMLMILECYQQDSKVSENFCEGLCNLGHASISVIETGTKLGTSRTVAPAFSIGMSYHLYVELGELVFMTSRLIKSSEKGLYTERSQMARRVISEEYQMDRLSIL